MHINVRKLVSHGIHGCVRVYVCERALGGKPRGKCKFSRRRVFATLLVCSSWHLHWCCLRPESDSPAQPRQEGTTAAMTATQTSQSNWRIPDLLAMKRDGLAYSEDQIAFLVRSVSDRSMDDCQLGALLMAVKLQDMTDAETIALTKGMRDSGSVFSWPKDWRVVDKHSTGGVGDKVSLALAPALAACGFKVPMISGRGLEHTGGTLDKLESIPGFKVSLTEAEMKKALEEVGCCIVGQTADIVPADRRMYAARDVTSTVKSVPLIVSSIISKKAAETVSGLVLDVKFGGGAFMKTQEEAGALAKKMVDVANGVGMATTALLTTMDVPLGRAIGNALEVRESLECLRGNGPEDLEELVTYLGGELLLSAGAASTLEEARQKLAKTLRDGSARTAFCNMIQKQGVTKSVAEALCGDVPDYSHLPSSVHVTAIKAASSGVLVGMDAMAMAKISLQLGAGRNKVGDPINYSVGIMLVKVVGESVKEGETWAELHHDSPLPPSLLQKMQGAVTIKASAEARKPSRVAARVV
ncbi:thymidine phosphorylase-like isoform X2 [Penaeus chinensis]|uniref:thymidine phosphorylase-like isoform X2 n=1 Tax=Penaeus chinensis TaxID=139456 RepID=UPI001FB83A8F|nr:thymidine phosphorylase-like isoform X2 [Penaeus chinensis]